jgi:hypothetical protein
MVERGVGGLLGVGLVGAVLAELSLGALELAVDHVFVADEAVEVHAVGQDEVGEVGGRGSQVTAGDFFQGALGALAGLVDGYGLEAHGPVQTPETRGDAFDAEGFEEVAGFVLAEQFFDQGVEFVGVFDGVIGGNDIASEQAVLEGVAAGTGLAFGGLGAAGLAAVAAAGFGLTLARGCSGHRSTSLP